MLLTHKPKIETNPKIKKYLKKKKKKKNPTFVGIKIQILVICKLEKRR